MQQTNGHDSEFGLVSLATGQLQSALDVFGEEVFEDSNGRYFADNMNCEIAINPVTSLEDWHSKTEGLLSQIRDKGFELVMKPVIVYPDRCMSHPLSKISGCNPDHSAYTRDTNQAPNFKQMDGTRSCGAHVHASLEGADPFNYARWMDALVTLPMLKYEEKTTRRDLYGKAGCMRVKEYGAEYRTLSNVWLDSEDKREFVFEMSHRAAELCKTQDPALIEDWWDIPIAIDTHDLELAERCIDRLYIYGVTHV
jgi:hypothetical protein